MWLLFYSKMKILNFCIPMITISTVLTQRGEFGNHIAVASILIVTMFICCDKYCTCYYFV